MCRHHLGDGGFPPKSTHNSYVISPFGRRRVPTKVKAQSRPTMRRTRSHSNIDHNPPDIKGSYRR